MERRVNMRKVTLSVKAKVMVPVMLTYSMTINADEGVGVERMARKAIKGGTSSNFDIEDSSFEITGVEGADPDAYVNATDTVDLNEQISDYVEGEQGIDISILDINVEDSR
jgi:hypothetical protein